MKCFRYFLSHLRFPNLFVQVCTFKSSTSLSKPLHVKFINQHNSENKPNFRQESLYHCSPEWHEIKIRNGIKDGHICRSRHNMLPESAFLL